MVKWNMLGVKNLSEHDGVSAHGARKGQDWCRSNFSTLLGEGAMAARPDNSPGLSRMESLCGR